MPSDLSDSLEPPGLAAEVRRLVADAAGRRSQPRRCHVGVPGGERVTLPELSVPDVALARDLVMRALDGLSGPDTVAWVTRFGPPVSDDGDRFWHTAALTGFERHGLRLRSFWLVHRRGYVELTSG